MEIVHTPTQKEFNRLMKHLETNGYNWICGGEKPTEWEPPSGFGLNTNVEISEVLAMNSARKGMSVDEYIGNQPKEKPIQRSVWFSWDWSNEMREQLIKTKPSTEVSDEVTEWDPSIPPFSWYYDNTIYKPKTKKMSIVKFAKNLTLSKDEKLLREQGLRNECGEWTDEADTIVAVLNADDRRIVLVDIAQKMKDEKKK